MAVISFEKLFPTTESKKCFIELLLLKFPLTYQRVLQGKDYIEVAQWIYDAIPKLQEKNYNTATRIYWILNNMIDFPHCKNCGKLFGIGKNVNVKNGYGKFCSRRCSLTSDETKANIDATFIKHYGAKRIYAISDKHKDKTKEHEIKTYQADSLKFQQEELSYYELFKKLPFPYPSVSDREIKLEVEKLTSQQIFSDKLPSAIIRRYCTSIWKCESHRTMSPMAYWEHMKSNFNDFKNLYENRMKYKGKITPDILREGMNVAKYSNKVTYFKPMLAKRLISKYLSDAIEIFNPFNGFSGIMLGATLGCNKKYVGQDINAEFVAEANRIISDLKLSNSSVIQKDLFKDLGEHDCLFCCPPYEDIEKWNFDIEGNPLDKNLTCDEWIDATIQRYKCNAYLFIVDKTEKYAKNIIERLGNKSHMNKNDELVLKF